MIRLVIAILNEVTHILIRLNFYCRKIERVGSKKIFLIRSKSDRLHEGVHKFLSQPKELNMRVVTRF